MVGNGAKRGVCGDSRLIVPRVDDVESLDDGDEDDAVGHVAKVAVLVHAPGPVHHNPAEHAGTELQPLLEVDLADEGESDAGG